MNRLVAVGLVAVAYFDHDDAHLWLLAALVFAVLSLHALSPRRSVLRQMWDESIAKAQTEETIYRGD